MENSIGGLRTMVGDSGQSGGYTLSAGDTLGQYKIIRPLGKGGMGEVYLAEHAILTTRHAVKLLPAERSDSAGFLDRFHDEARVMARLEHPGIVKVTHADEQSGRHYLVMEFVGAEGGEKPFDLEEALAIAPDNRLPPEAVARLGMQIAEAVGSAHKKGVVHRDLKPANVLLTSRDLDKASARVTDFGLARLLGEDWVRSVIDVSVRQSMSIGGSPTMMKAREDRSSTGSILGTYEYMSPEQRDGADVDERSDIYALGVMLYRMVTGKKLMGLAKPPSRLVKGLDPAWDDVIVSCLEEAPSDRPQNMGEVASSLDSLCRKALSQKKEEDSQRLQEAEDRRRAAERQREEDARGKKAAEESARKREQEQQRDPTAGNVAGMSFVEVKAGSFQMGTTSGGQNDERPVRTVRISRDFWMGKFEVTQREYQQITGKNPSHFKGDDLPVETVSWHDAVKFCEELTKRERAAGRLPQGLVYRLPTEAEWEYAARGGENGLNTKYAGSDNIDAVAWYDGNSGQKTQRVGTKAANELGLHDMSGNVWEWVHDWYQNNYSGLGTTDPVGPRSGSGRVYRGGGWYSAAANCRVADRSGNAPTYTLYDLGFRVVLAAPVQ